MIWGIPKSKGGIDERKVEYTWRNRRPCYLYFKYHHIFLSDNIQTSTRTLGRDPILLMTFPLIYLLVMAPKFDRPFLYYIQIGIMLICLIVLFLVDYVFKYDFRQTQWMVISFVVLYFAGMGGMIGIAAQAGRGWIVSAVILFFIAGVLAFVQRAITGI
jgi:hypothetical protein